MRQVDALSRVAEFTSAQWGLVTTSQAQRAGVSRMVMSRLAEAGHLERLVHGVYRDAGAPESPHESLHAAWLSLEPGLTAEERLARGTEGFVVAGRSAATLHGVGDFRQEVFDFVSPHRRQSQRGDIRHRVRVLATREVTFVEGLPVMSPERTIADLLDDVGDVSLVASCLAGFWGRSLDLVQLVELLTPRARRFGMNAGDGKGLLEVLRREAGVDALTIARRALSDPDLIDALGTSDVPIDVVAPSIAVLVEACGSWGASLHVEESLAISAREARTRPQHRV